MGGAGDEGDEGGSAEPDAERLEPDDDGERDALAGADGVEMPLRRQPGSLAAKACSMSTREMLLQARNSSRPLPAW